MLPTVDVHTHILPASYLKALDDLGIQTEMEDGFPEPRWSPEDHLAFMEATGQSFQVVTISSPTSCKTSSSATPSGSLAFAKDSCAWQRHQAPRSRCYAAVTTSAG